MNNSLLNCEDYREAIKKTIMDTIRVHALPVYTEDYVRENIHDVELNVNWKTFGKF